MKVIENKEVFPPRKHFVDVEEKFLNFSPRCRVLPAAYYDNHSIYFEIKKRYEPGENKYFPRGGFEVYGPEGSLHNYELDEVVVHPFHLGMTKYFSTQQNINKEKVSTGVKGKRGRPKIDPSLKKVKEVYVKTGGKRGRKPLSEEEKAKREAIKIAKNKISNGKRGRPKKQIS